jgi:protease IV
MNRTPSLLPCRQLSWIIVMLAVGFAVAWPTHAPAEEASAKATAEKSEPADDEADVEEITAKDSDNESSDSANSEASSDTKSSSEKSKAKRQKSNESQNDKTDKEGSTDKTGDDDDTKEEKTKKSASKDSKSEKKESAANKTATISTDSKKSETKRKKVRFALLTLKETLAESAGQMGPFGDVQLDLRELVNRLDKAADDKSIGGVVLNIQNPALGRGKIEELRDAIGRFRKSGKKVYAQIESAMPADYMIACACDEIVMPETGIVMLPGIHAEATFYKGLLKKIGLEADFIHVGAYKGAAEPYTREKFSDPVRENMNSMVDSLYDDMVTMIVKSRPLSIAQAKDVIDQGLITATRAKELGLIDRVAYPDALRTELAQAHQAEPLVYVKNYGQKKVDTDFSGPMGFFKLMQVMMGTDTGARKSRGKKIAIVYALGPIMSGESQSDLFGGQIMGSTTIVEALREANDDDEVAAIVLRVDSPGGSALASDLIWHETQVIEKPIVASMGDVAGSGGYYISMGADKIYATPGTITGSIGVVGGKLATSGLYEKLGITTETIERGKNSGLFSSSGKFTPSQRAALEEMMQDIYQQFTRKAADGRDMPLEKLEKLAGGRIYTGRQAKEIGLIDELGTLHDAINEAKKLAGIDEDDEVRIETLPEPTNFFESLFGDMDAEEEVRLPGNLNGLSSLEDLSPELFDAVRRASRLRAVFDQPAAFVMPFELEIR